MSTEEGFEFSSKGNKLQSDSSPGPEGDKNVEIAVRFGVAPAETAKHFKSGHLIAITYIFQLVAIKMQCL